MFGKNILDEKWPEFDEKYLVEDTISLPVQINGRFAKTITISRTASQDDVLSEIVSKYPELCDNIDTLKKVIYVPGKIVNLIK